jgi:hypothetical protein
LFGLNGAVPETCEMFGEPAYRFLFLNFGQYCTTGPV